MLNIIWPIFIIISIITSLFLGNIQEINSSLFESTEMVVELCIKLVGTMSLWCGIMNIASKTTLIDKIKKIINPLLNHLFSNSIKDKKINNEISMNIVSNLIGLGNAATPLRN